MNNYDISNHGHHIITHILAINTIKFNLNEYKFKFIFLKFADILEVNTEQR